MRRNLSLAILLTLAVLVGDHALSQATNVVPIAGPPGCQPGTNVVCILVLTARGPRWESITVPVPTVQTGIPGSAPCSSFSTVANPNPVLSLISAAGQPQVCTQVGVFDPPTGMVLVLHFPKGWPLIQMASAR